MIATVRRGEADEAVAGLVRALPVDQAVELAVGPLDPGALGRLVHARTGTWMAPPALARLHAACEGNPLLALELIRAPGADAASDIRRLLAARVGALAPETRAALRFVAALAEPTLGAVEAAIDAPGGLEEALAADVLVRDGSRLRFSHPLIGAVVAGAHAARRVARDPRPARRADGPAGAARTPSRRRGGRARRSRGGGARGGGRRGGDARRDEGGRGPG